MLERFGLGEFAQAWPWQLSGGMRQRAAFLRTVIAGHPLMLLDEPFGALDGITRADLQEWLSKVWAEFGPPSCWSPTTSPRPCSCPTGCT